MIHTLELGAHNLVIGQITETFIDEDCLRDGQADVIKIDPLVYSTGADQYQRLGEVIGKAFSIGREG